MMVADMGRKFTCHNCGKEFRRNSQWEFFCSNPCRNNTANSLGIEPEELMSGDFDDLAIIIYGDYLNEINEKPITKGDIDA